MLDAWLEKSEMSRRLIDDSNLYIRPAIWLNRSISSSSRHSASPLQYEEIPNSSQPLCSVNLCFTKQSFSCCFDAVNAGLRCRVNWQMHTHKRKSRWEQVFIHCQRFCIWFYDLKSTAHFPENLNHLWIYCIWILTF